jgi:hypothetical protein
MGWTAQWLAKSNSFRSEKSSQFTKNGKWTVKIHSIQNKQLKAQVNLINEFNKCLEGLGDQLDWKRMLYLLLKSYVIFL